MPYTHAHSHYHLLRMKEMGRIFWCHSIGALGVSLVVIFVPIFLLKSNYSFSAVLLYLLLQQALAAALQYPAGRLLQYIHPHRQLAIGTLWYAVFFGLLITLHTYHWPLGLLALAWALNRTMYWAAFHYSFGLARGQTHAGRQIAGVTALVVLAQTAAPAIGGIVATAFGIKYIYITAIITLLIAIVPMFKTGVGPPRVKLHISWPAIYTMRRDALANVCNGIVVLAEQSLWPLLVFLVVSSYAGVGVLSSMIAVASIGVTLYVGRQQETRGERYYIKRGLAAYSLTSLGRALVENSVQIFGLNLLGGVGRSLYVTPFMNRYYSNSDGLDRDGEAFRLGYITVMETAFSIGSSLFLLILLALSLWLSVRTALEISLAAVALAVMGVRSMR
jgi:MFS family permease